MTLAVKTEPVIERTGPLLRVSLVQLQPATI